MIADYFVLAFGNLRKRGLRSWLTILGIFIGIAAVVSLISLGQGLQGAIDNQFAQLGKDKIVITPNLMGPPGSVTSKSLILTTDDLKTIENVRGVDWAVGMLMKTSQVKFKTETKSIYVIGIAPDDMKKMAEVQQFGILDGRDLKDGDKFKVVVGYNNNVADKIWKKPIELKSALAIEGKEFSVIGIRTKIGNPYDDAAAYMDKETLRELLNSGDEESEIIVKTSSGFDPAVVADDIKRELAKARGEKKGQETFSISTSEQLLASFTNIFSIVQAVLIGITAISLLVGGIGIMNTMYTSVLERTKEIGVMKAIGAKNSDILLIFLIEAGLLGLVGGVIGVGLGMAMAKGGEFAAIALGTNLLKASFSPWLIFGALAFSFLVGSLSGVLPAMQASKLKPVDALRYE